MNTHVRVLRPRHLSAGATGRRVIPWFLILVVMSLAATAPTTGPADAFRKNSSWRGHERNPSGRQKAAENGWGASMRVVARDGNNVTFNYFVAGNGGRRGVQIKGTLDAEGKIMAKVTKVLPGLDWHETMVGTHISGTVSGKTVIINRKSQHGASLSAELKLQEKDNEQGTDNG